MNNVIWSNARKFRENSLLQWTKNKTKSFKAHQNLHLSKNVIMVWQKVLVIVSFYKFGSKEGYDANLRGTLLRKCLSTQRRDLSQFPLLVENHCEIVE